MSRATLAALLVAAALSAPEPARASLADSARAGPGAIPEAPVDADDDADVTFERAADDTAAGVEVGFSLLGTGRGAPRRGRSVRFTGEGLDGVVRDGADDPLAGAEVGGRSAVASWRMGRSAPQWGCGWLVGAPAAPWGEAASPIAGLRAGPRGEVATFSAGDTRRIEALAGRFAKREVAALRLEAGGAGVTAAATRRGFAAAGILAGGENGRAELAFDRHGRWRGEAAVGRESPLGRLALRARAGSAGFRPLLAPTRGGPPHALAAEWSAGSATVRPRAGVALWRFGNGLTGARGRLEVDLRLAHHAAWSLGLEEQQGTRREGSAGRGMRQGWWGEWRGGSGPLALTLGLESWGRRSRARSPVRSATLAAVELEAPFGARLRAEQRTFRSGSGEGYRAPDLEADRLVLRALSGAGERTRIEMTWPGPAGRLRAGWTFTATASRAPRTQWTLDWTRRARIRAAPS